MLPELDARSGHRVSLTSVDGLGGQRRWVQRARNVLRRKE